MKKAFLILLLTSLSICGCNTNSLTKEEIDKYVIKTAEEWDDAFDYAFFSNFTLKTHSCLELTLSRIYVDDFFMTNENGAFVQWGKLYSDNVTPSIRESYYVIKQNEKWIKYQSNEDNTGYYKYDDGISEIDYQNSISTHHLNYISYKLDYERFTFNEKKKRYECNDDICHDFDDSCVYILTRNNVVTFENGKLSSMSGCYDIVDPRYCVDYMGDYFNTFEIYNINKTIVTPPTNIVDE